MSDPDDLLTTTEGVDEGSAASTAEGPGSGASPHAGHAAEAAGEAPAPPEELDTDEARTERAKAGPGQQQQVGEG